MSVVRAVCLVALLLLPSAHAAWDYPGSGDFVFIDYPASGSTVSGATWLGGVAGQSDGAAGTCPRDAGDDGWVVIALVDTGINPYHNEFVPIAGQPSGHPSEYICGYPAATPALPLTCTATTKIHTACKSDFATVAWEQMHWIPGTRIVGAVGFKDPFAGSTPILDEHGHGTSVASVSAGNAWGTCSKCLIVAVEGYTGLQWAADQPWIDIISNSWGAIVDLVPGGMGMLANSKGDLDATQAYTETGGSVLFAAGNGLYNSFTYPNPTHTMAHQGADWHMVVGAVKTADDNSIMASGKPVTVSSFAWGNIPSACKHSTTAKCNFGGTSAATPITAGVMGQILYEARLMLDSHLEGPRGAGVIAKGAPVLGHPTLGDGELTRQELWRYVTNTARPLGAGDPSTAWPMSWGASPADFAYAGYGIVDATTRDDALMALWAGGGLPDRPEVDAFLLADAEIRHQLWGLWGEHKLDWTVAHRTPGGAPDVGVWPGPYTGIELWVNGNLIDTVDTDATGAWLAEVDFYAIPQTPAGEWEVLARHGAADAVSVYVGAAPPPPPPPAPGPSFTLPPEVEYGPAPAHQDTRSTTGVPDCPSCTSQGSVATGPTLGAAPGVPDVPAGRTLQASSVPDVPAYGGLTPADGEPVSLPGSVPVRDLDQDGIPDHRDADADGDGVLDIDELAAGSDPYDARSMPLVAALDPPAAAAPPAWGAAMVALAAAIALLCAVLLRRPGNMKD